MSGNDAPWIAHPDAVEPAQWPYCEIRHLPPSAGEAMRVSHVTLEPGGAGPLVRHRRSAELVFVAEGEVDAWVGDGATRCATGTVVFLPPTTVHGFKAIGGARARLLVVHVPHVDPGEDHERVADDFQTATERADG